LSKFGAKLAEINKASNQEESIHFESSDERDVESSNSDSDKTVIYKPFSRDGSVDSIRTTEEVTAQGAMKHQKIWNKRLAKRLRKEGLGE
jgi:hypothetical protein